MKLHIPSFLQLSVILLIFLSGCIDEEHGDCPQGLVVSLYSKSPCQSDAVYPAGISDVTLGVFDKNGVLVTYLQRNNVSLSEDYSEELAVNSGLYTVIAWSGVDAADFNVNELKPGATKKNDLYLQLKRAQTVARSIEGRQIYVGESPAVYVQENSSESGFEQVLVNMQEVTNRLTVTVEGLIGSPDQYEVIIESANGAMNVDGTLAADDVLVHEPVVTPDFAVLNAAFTLLKLETGSTNTLVVRSKTTGEELYRGSLLGTLLLKNPEVNLACDHDFTIRFTAEDQCNCGTYTIMEIWVNNWLVHSYDTEM